MTEFYSQVMGFPITDRGRLPSGLDIVFLSRDPSVHHQIALVSGRPEAVPFNVVNQISFRVDDLSALRAYYQAVERESVEALVAILHGNAWSIYFRDPEGNRLEVFSDTPWYVTQPLVEEFDLSLSDAEIYAFTESRCRELPGFKPIDEWRSEVAEVMRASQID